MSVASTNRVQSSPAVGEDEPGLSVLESDPTLAQRRRATDDLFVAATVVLSIVFAIALARYVLSPAVKTVTNATTSSSHAGGP